MSAKQKRLQLLRRQIQRLDSRLAELNDLSNRYSYIRLAIIIIGLLLTFVALSQSTQRNAVLIFIITMAIFSLVVRFHRHVKMSIEQHTIYRHIKQTHIARMQLDWAA
ncbi:MAG: hypothetical protein D6737_01580, partial [Chloroflexi bacterium]